MRVTRAFVVACMTGLFGTTGCSKAELADAAMRSARHPIAHHGRRVGPYEILGGDLHCHVSPPDSPRHATRDLPATVALAESEGLDFVVLTPHVPSRFFADEDELSWVVETQAALAQGIARLSPSLVVVPGFEYTDHRYGHVGAAFADLDTVLKSARPGEFRAHPERFFERWIAHGGLLTTNHPLLLPMPGSPIRELRSDMSFRGFDPKKSVPPEMAFIATHTQTVETFNLSVMHLRDQFMIGDEERSLRQAAHLVDRLAREQHRKITPVGGTDSHGGWLRPTTFVLAKGRTAEAVRNAIVEGRTCVRGPEACTLEIRADGGPWKNVGDDLSTEAMTVDVRTGEENATIFVNGEVAGHTASATTTVLVPVGRCALVRAVAGRSWSAPIYVNCSSAP